MLKQRDLCACRMTDADATKPDDWDEDAPRQIEDDDAEKPDGWLDDEPAEIDDPGKQPWRPCSPSTIFLSPGSESTNRKGIESSPTAMLGIRHCHSLRCCPRRS